MAGVLGYVFCENRILQGMKRINVRAAGCGILEVLVAMCLKDNDANPEARITTLLET